MTDERRRPRRGGVETGLRTAAVWSRVSDLATARSREIGRPLRVLDLGGGTGGLAVPLAELGHDVRVVDPSADALASLSRRAAESRVADRITAVQGDADTLPDVVAAGEIDLVCCHGTLEVVEDPAAVLGRIGEVLAPGGHLSLVTAQRLAAVLSRALAGRFAEAREALVSADGRWGPQDPLPRRFDRDHLLRLLGDAGFTAEVVHGVRLFSDLVPSALVDSETDRVALLELERASSEHEDYGFLGELGSSVHILARRN
ncbi:MULTISPECIES: methyltransferase domain-containing protein [unclassified Janibacter]|uniref:methyltransferase domain-containing protein n=1 Tax=unclassified Janibacter TaxID=2649294 RepID=UPI003CFF0F65